MKGRTRTLPVISTPVILKVIQRKWLLGVCHQSLFIDACEVMSVIQIFLW